MGMFSLPSIVAASAPGSNSRAGTKLRIFERFSALDAADPDGLSGLYGFDAKFLGNSTCRLMSS
jgi:hypothetical protein